jgi:hypothetical protein
MSADGHWPTTLTARRWPASQSLVTAGWQEKKEKGEGKAWEWAWLGWLWRCLCIVLLYVLNSRRHWSAAVASSFLCASCQGPAQHHGHLACCTPCQSLPRFVQADIRSPKHACHHHSSPPTWVHQEVGAGLGEGAHDGLLALHAGGGPQLDDGAEAHICGGRQGGRGQMWQNRKVREEAGWAISTGGVLGLSACGVCPACGAACCLRT